MDSKTKALFDRAQGLAGEGRYDEALMCLEMATNAEPKFKEAHNEKGNVLLAMGEADKAIACFDAATKVDPSYAEAWENKEAAYLVRGKYNDAVRCLDELTKIQPEDPGVWVDKGSLHFNLHRFEDAVKAFNKALELLPGEEAILSKKEEAMKCMSGMTDREVRRITKKLCLLGDPSVGKTSLIRRYVYDVFEDKYLSTIGAKVTRKVLTLRGQEPEPGKPMKVTILTLMIWDIGGQKDFKNVQKAYYRGAHGTLIVSDTTRRETLEHTMDWANALFEVTGTVPLVFLSNKEDLLIQAAFGMDELKEFASQFTPYYFTTSAKTGKNVEMAFATVGREMLKFSKQRT